MLRSHTLYFARFHCMETVLRDPLSYVTFSLRSLEGSYITVSTVPCIEHEKRILSVHPLRFTLHRHSLHYLVPPDVSVCHPLDLNIYADWEILQTAVSSSKVVAKVNFFHISTDRPHTRCSSFPFLGHETFLGKWVLRVYIFFTETID